MSEETRDRQGGVAGRPLFWRLATGFVVVTLIALVLVPWVVQQRVTTLRQEIVGAERARTLVTRWQFTIVRELTALAGAGADGVADPAAYRTAHADRTRVVRELAPVVRSLGSGVAEAYGVARAIVDAWDAQGRPRPPANDVLAAIGALDAAILARTAAARDRIATAERAGLVVTLLLGLLALLAAGAVLGLSRRLRRAVGVAEARRREAAEALAATEKANAARASLLRGISHDVKNPLGAAKGYADLLAMGVKAPLAPEQAPLVQGVERSINSALRILGDLLDLARLESGGLSVERIEVDLNALAREAASDHEGAARSAGHEIEARTRAEPLRVYTDPDRVRQVVDNLVANAIKYTPPPGRIEVRTEERTDGEAAAPHAGDDAGSDAAWAAIVVADTGPGIPADQREAIFDEFTRLDGGSSAKGHGLGLAIARGIARRLDGELFVAGPEEGAGEGAGEGATFVLRLPRRR